METNRHNIKAHVGETFTIDKVVRNRDGSPYIISNELQNPYVLLTVSDNEYGQFNGFYRNYWLRLQDYPRFTLTQPLHYSKVNGFDDPNPFPDYQKLVTPLYNFLTTCFESRGGTKYDDECGMAGKWEIGNNVYFNSILKDTKYDIDFVSNNISYHSISYSIGEIAELDMFVIDLYYDDFLVASGNYYNSTGEADLGSWTSDEYKTIYISLVSNMTVTIDGEMYNISPEFAVIEDKNGEYVYWSNGWKPYECRIVKTFLSHDTKNWPAQKYYYSLQLVYGNSTTDALRALATSYGIQFSTDFKSDNYMSNVDLYNKLSELGHTFPAGFDGESPIFEPSSIPFLSKAELVMENYPQGGIY